LLGGVTAVALMGIVVGPLPCFDSGIPEGEACPQRLTLGGHPRGGLTRAGDRSEWPWCALLLDLPAPGVPAGGCFAALVGGSFDFDLPSSACVGGAVMLWRWFFAAFAWSLYPQWGGSRCGGPRAVSRETQTDKE